MASDSLTQQAHTLASALMGRHYSEHTALILAAFREVVEQCATLANRHGRYPDGTLMLGYGAGTARAIANGIRALLEE